MIVGRASVAAEAVDMSRLVETVVKLVDGLSRSISMQDSILMTDLTALVQQYFAGEREEMLLLLGFAVLLAIAGMVLLSRGQQFGRSLGVVLLVASALGATNAVPILLRDQPHRDALLTAVAGDEREEAVALEIERMTGVLNRYPMYRYAYVALLLAAVGTAVMARSQRGYAVAVGLVIIAGTGLVVDQYSERRAVEYHRGLAHAVEQGL